MYIILYGTVHHVIRDNLPKIDPPSLPPSGLGFRQNRPQPLLPPRFELGTFRGFGECEANVITNYTMEAMQIYNIRVECVSLNPRQSCFSFLKQEGNSTKRLPPPRFELEAAAAVAACLPLSSRAGQQGRAGLSCRRKDILPECPAHAAVRQLGSRWVVLRTSSPFTSLRACL